MREARRYFTGYSVSEDVIYVSESFNTLTEAMNSLTPENVTIRPSYCKWTEEEVREEAKRKNTNIVLVEKVFNYTDF